MLRRCDSPVVSWSPTTGSTLRRATRPAPVSADQTVLDESQVVPAVASAADVQTFGSIDIVVVDSIAAVAEPAVPAGTITAGAIPAGNGVEGAMVTVVCAIDDGADDLWGTTDDVFGGPVSAVVGADGTYDVAPTGDACWISVAPPPGYMVPGETSELESASTPQVLDLSSSTIAPIEIVATVAPAATTGPGTRRGRGVGRPRQRRCPGRERTVRGWSHRDTVRRWTAPCIPPASPRPRAGTCSPTCRSGEYTIGVSNLPTGMVASGVLGMTAPFSVSAEGSPSLAIGLRPAPVVVPEADSAAQDGTDPDGAQAASPAQRRAAAAARRPISWPRRPRTARRRRRWPWWCSLR